MKMKIKINGMSCMHCVKHVNECLSGLEGVTSVEVNLEGKSAIIECNKEIGENIIKSALDEYGYEAVNFERI
ncbi:heavy metal-associated domain-containing protein [Clostridium sp. CTA-19]